jgi:large conductance mechanosensitive channel
MGFVKEFKEFAMRGNVIDMAVGIIIGAAFGKIISSFVSDVVMPPLGMLTGGVDFADKKLVLKEAVLTNGTVTSPAVSVNYGVFINAVIDFLLVALAIFVVIKFMNRLRRKESPAPAPPPGPTPDQKLLMEIRDAIRANARS